MNRTNNCGELSKANINQNVKLSGWVNKIREKGFIIWIDLRDRYGITQLVFDKERSSEELFDAATKLGREFVIEIEGAVIERKNINEIFYYDGKQAVMDILNFKIIKSKKIDNSLIRLSKTYINKIKPIIPIGASELMEKYKIPEGKQLGLKLKLIEELWIKNNFKISDHQVEKIVKD